MSVRAAYIMNDYLKSIINPVVAPDTIDFHPGDYAPEAEDHTFATYSYVANRDFEQPYIHLDGLQVKIHHSSYMKLKEMIDKILAHLSLENPHDNPALIAAGAAEGIKWHDVVVRVATTDKNQFIESTDYYFDVLDILLQYVETPQEGNLTAFIEGV